MGVIPMLTYATRQFVQLMYLSRVFILILFPFFCFSHFILCALYVYGAAIPIFILFLCVNRKLPCIGTVCSTMYPHTVLHMYIVACDKCFYRLLQHLHIDRTATYCYGYASYTFFCSLLIFFLFSLCCTRRSDAVRTVFAFLFNSKQKILNIFCHVRYIDNLSFKLKNNNREKKTELRTYTIHLWDVHISHWIWQHERIVDNMKDNMNMWNVFLCSSTMCVSFSECRRVYSKLVYYTFSLPLRLFVACMYRSAQ